MEWTIRLEVKTGRGEVERIDLATITRPAVATATAAEVGLRLAEAKALLAGLQASMVRTQLAEQVALGRLCPGCEAVLRVKDRRPRRLQTLFGTVEVEATRFKPCPCRPVPGAPGATVSPVRDLLRGARCTPELERVQAELGARTSFREAARILTALLPVGAANHAGVRSRTHAVGRRLEAGAASPAATNGPTPDEIVVALDGAYVRAAPGCQTRHFEVVLGKVEAGTRSSRRFALVARAAGRPHTLLRDALADQGWTAGKPITAISDGDPALPALVGAAAQGPVGHIIDWFHLSMRVRHVEQVVRGLSALGPRCSLPVDFAQAEVERVRHLLWNGRHEEAHASLGAVAAVAGAIDPLNGPGFERKAARLAALCRELRGYIGNNQASLIDYGRRHRAGEPISSSRAESTVNQLVNARMNKRRQMRWSPVGAHRLLQVRAAVLDGRLHEPDLRAAA
jgi:hypothetical protein